MGLNVLSNSYFIIAYMKLMLFNFSSEQIFLHVVFVIYINIAAINCSKHLGYSTSVYGEYNNWNFMLYALNVL